MAIVAALFVSLLLTCLGTSLVLLGSTGTALAAHDRRQAAAERAAESAFHLAASELRDRTDWTGLLAGGAPADVCAEPGRLADTSLFPRPPWASSAIDLHGLTQQLQVASDRAAPLSGGPVWRVFDYGPISRLIPSEAWRHPSYVVVWAADGGEGIVLLHATALGPAGSGASVEGAVARESGGVGLARLTVRSVPR